MTDPLAPYDAVLVASYGGPNGPDDVLPFMRNATAGKGIPDSRLLEVSKHYELFGGRSPINELNAALMEQLRAELERRGSSVEVLIGNRNWHPFFGDTARELVAGGQRRVVALATSAYRSYSSCRQYHEDLAGANAETGNQLQIDKLGPFAETDGFVAAATDSLVRAINNLSPLPEGGKLRVLFVTHSIPEAMEQASGPGTAELGYDAQTRRVAQRVAEAAEARLGYELTHELVYCSRSGPPQVPWLEPDVNDRLEELPAEGVTSVVAAPIGFISDHMEVAYDLDTEAKATAAELGLAYERAATVGTDPAFVSMLVDLLFEQAAIARGELAAPAHACYFAEGTCCLPKPSQTRRDA